MKKLYLYIIAFVTLCSLGNIFVNHNLGKQIENKSPFRLSFASIGANLLESRLDCWAKIKTVNNFEEMDQALIQILSYLDLPIDRTHFQYNEDPLQMELQYEIYQNQNNYSFILQSEKKDNRQSYFLLTMISNVDDQEMLLKDKKVKELFECKTYYSYKGLIDSQVDDKGKEKLLQVLSKYLQIKYYDNYRDENVISITGYSPKLANYIDTVKAGTTNLNIQTVIKSNSKENKSYIYLGCPLLLNDY